MDAASTPPPFHAAVETIDGLARVRLEGELDLATVAAAEEAIARARRQSRGPLRIDLSQVTFLDSSGMRLIMRVHQHCEADGCTLSITPGPRGVQRVFDVAGVDGMLPFAPDPL